MLPSQPNRNLGIPQVCYQPPIPRRFHKRAMMRGVIEALVFGTALAIIILATCMA